MLFLKEGVQALSVRTLRWGWGPNRKGRSRTQVSGQTSLPVDWPWQVTLEVAGRLGRSVDLFQNLNCLVMGTPTRLFEGQFVPYLGIPLCIIIDQKSKYLVGFTVNWNCSWNAAAVARGLLTITINGLTINFSYPVAIFMLFNGKPFNFILSKRYGKQHFL